MRPTQRLVFERGDGTRADVVLENVPAADASPASAAILAHVGASSFRIVFEDDRGDAAIGDAARGDDARGDLRSIRAIVEASGEARHVVRARFAEAGEMRYLAIGVETFAFRDLARVPAHALETSGGDGRLRAPTGGRVLAVRVAPGERLAAKATAIVLEAMKMEHAVSLPVDATVLEVTVVPGDRVDRGATLLRYTAEGPPHSVTTTTQ